MICRRTFGILFALAGLAIPMRATGSTVVFQENFEDAAWVIGNQVDVAGPLSWVLSNIPTNGTATIQATQIGSGGSKSMHLDDFTNGVSGSECRIQMTSAGLNGWNTNQGVARGVIQFDARCISSLNVNIRLYDDAPAANANPANDDMLVTIMFGPSLLRIGARDAADTASANFDSTPWANNTDYRFIITFDQGTRDLSVQVKDGAGYSNTFYSTGAVKVRNTPGTGFTGVRGFQFSTGAAQIPVHQFDNFIVTETGSGVEDWRALD